MTRKVCCVTGCRSNSDTHCMYRFPNIKDMLELWKMYVFPHNPVLLSLEEYQLTHRVVCQLHFERRMFDMHGRRMRNAYPTLFSSSEISQGTPLLTYFDLDDEHNYHQRNTDKIEDNPREFECMLHEQVDSCKTKAAYKAGRQKYVRQCYYGGRKDPKIEEPDEEVQYLDDNIFDGETSVDTASYAKDGYTKISNTEDSKITVKKEELRPKITLEIPRNEPILDSKANILPSVPFQDSDTQHPAQLTFQTMAYKYNILKEEHRKLTHRYSVLQKSNELLRRKGSPSKHDMFEMLTTELNPIAKNFFRSQLWPKKSQRFSVEEKILALSVIKLSGECYKLLQKIFLLPSPYVLKVLYKSIIGNKPIKKEMDSNEIVRDEYDVQNKDDETENSNAIEDIHVFEDSPGDTHEMEDYFTECNVLKDSSNHSNVLQLHPVHPNSLIQTNLNNSNVLQDNVKRPSLLQTNLNELREANVEQNTSCVTTVTRPKVVKKPRSQLSEIVLANGRKVKLKYIPQDKVVRLGQELKLLPELEKPLASMFDSMTKKIRRKARIEIGNKISVLENMAEKIRGPGPDRRKNKRNISSGQMGEIAKPGSSGYFKRRKL